MHKEELVKTILITGEDKPCYTVAKVFASFTVILLGNKMKQQPPMRKSLQEEHVCTSESSQRRRGGEREGREKRGTSNEKRDRGKMERKSRTTEMERKKRERSPMGHTDGGGAALLCILPLLGSEIN